MINSGEVNVETKDCNGTTLITEVPDSPGESVFAGVDAGKRLETVTTNEAAHCELMVKAFEREVEPRWVESPE